MLGSSLFIKVVHCERHWIQMVASNNGSRISRGGDGRQALSLGWKPIIRENLCGKLEEKERNWTEEEGVSLAPPFGSSNDKAPRKQFASKLKDFLNPKRLRSLQNLIFSKLQTFELYQNRLHKKAFNINVFVFEKFHTRMTWHLVSRFDPFSRPGQIPGKPPYVSDRTSLQLLYRTSRASPIKWLKKGAKRKVEWHEWTRCYGLYGFL